MSKAFLYHAEVKKMKSDWTVAQTNRYSFLQKCKSELVTSIVTMETKQYLMYRNFFELVYNHV